MLVNTRAIFFVLPALLLGFASPVLPDDHAGTGAQLFQSCISCHEIGPDARNKVGPPLNGIIGSPAANSEGFRYSRALVARAEAGLVWDEAALDDFMANPSAFIPGTRMSFSGVRKKSDRAALLAFMATLVPETGLGVAHLEPGDPEVTPEILAIEGNVEYGKYLSATCVTCHQASGKSDGIPPIINWPAPAFVTVLHAYRSKARDNQVMQQIAGTLSDEEIAALAAYYESIQP